MKRLYNLVETPPHTAEERRRCVVTSLNILVGFVAGCLFTTSIISIIAHYAATDSPPPTLKDKLFEPLDRPIYISWDSFDLPTFNTDTPSGGSVCFDYDDTIAFTTPTFAFAKNLSSVNVDQMWDIVNNEHVGTRLSINKHITSLILRRYAESAPSSPLRIITARCSPSPERIEHDETNIQRQIAKIIPNATNLRVYMSCTKMSGRMNKIQAIKHFGCRVMFGDSDDDIRSCILAGNCCPFRILRAANSSYTSDNNPGLFHEPIILNSDY